MAGFRRPATRKLLLKSPISLCIPDFSSRLESGGVPGADQQIAPVAPSMPAGIRELLTAGDAFLALLLKSSFTRRSAGPARSN